MGRQATHLHGIDFITRFQRRSLNHAPKPRPEPTARSAVRGRREAPSVAAAAVAITAAAVVVAAAVAKFVLCSIVLCS